MKKENLNIEDFFRQSFDGYRINPSSSVWQRINLRLDIRQFFKPGFSHFNFYYSCIIILVGTFFTYHILNTNNEPRKNTGNINLVNPNPVQANTKANQQSDRYDLNKVEDKKIALNQKNKTEEYQSIEIGSFDDQDTLTFQVIHQVRNLDPLLNMAKDSFTPIKNLVPEVPKPLFTLSAKEGCVPFELKIKNYTLGAVEYHWNFGDGSNSKDEIPQYTYLYPGIYKIQLKVKGLGGSALSVIDSVIVHDKPVVKTFWPYKADVLVGEKIVIPIKSTNAIKFEWDFGDGGVVRKKQGEYAYKNTGDYEICLKSWTDKNCFDSIKIADIKVVSSQSKIIFPNAFCPNPDGPSTGRYSGRETYFDIFHPYVKGKLTEYKLSIYSKVGGIVFESSDVNVGWDGYFEDRLMPEGVYPYIATGKFENGESFLEKGNVTIIYRK